MGFSFYVCNKCGQVNSESDLGHHQNNCKRDLMSKEDIIIIEEWVNKEFGQYRISQRFLKDFHKFWNAFDYLLEHRNESNSETYLNNLKFVKSFLW